MKRLDTISNEGLFLGLVGCTSPNGGGLKDPNITKRNPEHDLKLLIHLTCKRKKMTIKITVEKRDDQHVVVEHVDGHFSNVWEGWNTREEALHVACLYVNSCGDQRVFDIVDDVDSALPFDE